MNVTVEFPQFNFDVNALDRPKLLELFKIEMVNTSARLRSVAGKGQGADGQAIKGGYSPSYIKAIAKGQVRGGSGGKGVRKTTTAPVNLTISGDLLGSMQIRATPDGAEIFFNGKHYSGLSNAELASVLLGHGFVNWFEYGQVDIKRIEASVGKHLDAALKNLLAGK